MTKRIWLALALALLAAAAPAFAKDEVEYARALARGGYFDLAQQICEEVASGRGSSEDRSSVDFIKAEIMLTQAELESDPGKATGYIEEAVKGLDAFIAKNPSHPLVSDAKLTLGRVQMRKAQLLAEQLKVETDPGKKADLQKQVAGLYTDVVKSYRNKIAGLKSKESTPQIDGELMDARLELPRALLDQVRFGGPEADEKKKLLTEAIGVLDEFQFDYGDRPVAYEAMRITGECYSELGNLDKALESLTMSMEIIDRLIEAGIPPNEFHLNIYRGAVISTARIYVKNARFKDAVSVIDSCFTKDKTLKGTDTGYVMTLMKAQALFEGGEADKANAIAKKIIDEDQGGQGKWAAAAKDKVQSWLAGPSSKSRGASAEQLMTAAESLFERGKWLDALTALRNCIEAATSPADREKFVPTAYYKMGQSLLYLKPARNYEAAWAFAKVCAFKKNPLAPKACFQAVSCYNREFVLSGDERDDQLKDQYMKLMKDNWPNDPSARNFAYLLAEKLEGQKKWTEAAEAYLKVDKEAEAYESALVRAGYCYYTDALAKWKDSKKDAAAKTAVLPVMKKAEDAFNLFLPRTKDASLEPSDEELKKMRANLIFIAQQQLALLYSHEAMGKAEACLQLVDDAAAALPPDDERIGKLWGLKIQAYLTLNQVDKAVEILDQMFEKFPDGQPIAVASKSVAIRLHQSTMDMIDSKKGDEETITKNLKKVSTYYDKWLNEGPSVGLRITLQDVISVAGTLYMVAKRVNGLDEKITSFLDLKDTKIQEKDYFKKAAFVHSMLVDGKAGALSDKDKIDLMTRLARCYSFQASSADDWKNAKAQYDQIMKAYKLTDDAGNLNGAAIQAQPSLLIMYLELGAVLMEVGKFGDKFQFDNAVTIFGNVQKVTQGGSEPWWFAKYMQLTALFLRGSGSDIDMASVGLDNLERNYPNYDDDKFGMKAKFVELKKKVDAVKPK